MYQYLICFLNHDTGEAILLSVHDDSISRALGSFRRKLRRQGSLNSGESYQLDIYPNHTDLVFPDIFFLTPIKVAR